MLISFGVISAAVILSLLIFRMATMTTTTQWVIGESGEGTGIGASAADVQTGNDIISSTITVPISTTDQESDVAFDVADLAALVITTNTQVTLCTNAASTGAPDDTIVLKPNHPWVWTKDSGIACPISGAAGVVSSIFLTNASATVVATVKFRGIQTL